MRHLLAALMLLPLPVLAAPADLVRAAVDRHILPRTDALAEATEALSATAAEHCEASDPVLRDAFGAAFDAWLGVAHLTFGPAEDGDRYFALSFWPDTRGLTPRTLSSLIEAADPVAEDAATYADVSVAARGFYALEMLLYDDAVSAAGEAAYRCDLIRAVAGDIDATATGLADAWRDDFAGLMTGAGDNDRFRTPDEAVQTLYGALDHGLEFTADVRLGRPLGTWDDPRPDRAEAWRSARSLRHVALSLEALRDLAARLASDDPKAAAAVDARFAAALDRAAGIDDPAFAGVADPGGRFEVELLQQAVRAARDTVRADLGPALGVAAGFNALDGD